LDRVAGFGIDLAVLDAISSFLVDLMEADLLSLGRCREEGDRTRDQRELEVAFPVCAWCHGRSPKQETTLDVSGYGTRSVPSRARTGSGTSSFLVCSGPAPPGDLLPPATRDSMGRSAPERQGERHRRTFYATMHVTRAEEWCVEALSLEEARALLGA